MADVSNQRIIDRRERLEEKCAKAEAKVKGIRAELEALQDVCKHPNAVFTSHMGENCRHCYDCGYCR